MDAQWVDNGPGWVGLLLADAATVPALEPGPLPYGEIRDVGVIGPYPADPVNESRIAFDVRAFAPSPLVEDPVTGSLNASLAQWLIGSGRAPAHYVAEQGTRLGRAGRIDIESDHGEIWVGGDTVVDISGTVAL